MKKRLRTSLTIRLVAATLMFGAFVAIVFGSLINAIGQARIADRQSQTAATLIERTGDVRSSLYEASIAAKVRAREAQLSREALAVATLADRAGAPRTAALVRRSVGAFHRDPDERTLAELRNALSSTAERQRAGWSRRSDDLGNRLVQSLALGVIGLLGSVVSIVLLVVTFIQRLSLPIQRIRGAAARIGAGDLSTRVQVAGNDEVGRLAASVNSVAETLQQTQDELAASRAEAEAAYQAKSAFLSRMSHELRTPLNAILGFSQLLEVEERDERQRENVGHITHAGSHLLALINDVLEMSRVEAGGITPTSEPVHLPSALRDALELVTPLAAERGTPIQVDRSAHAELYVLADAQALRQILLNLLSNAVKYNREAGTVTIGVEVRGNRGRVLVTDEGQGIADDQREKLFVPFERLGAQESGVEGTGLGLSLAQRLAESMGGRIGVESRPWTGSTFHVELALAEAPEVVPEPVEETPRHGGAEPVVLRPAGRCSILYIEDDAANFRLVERVLQAEGDVNVLHTMQGKLGLDIAREHQPDLILLDLHLPDIHGSDVLARLRARPETGHIPVVVLSADATAAQIARLRAAGAADYLTKPLEVEQLVAAIWTALDRRPKRLAAAAGGRVA